LIALRKWRSHPPPIEDRVRRTDDEGTVAVDGPIQIHPAATHPYIGLVDVPSLGGGPLAPIESLAKLGGVSDNQAADCSVIHLNAPLGHHLLEIPWAEAVSQIPRDRNGGL